MKTVGITRLGNRQVKLAPHGRRLTEMIAQALGEETVKVTWHERAQRSAPQTRCAARVAVPLMPPLLGPLNACMKSLGPNRLCPNERCPAVPRQYWSHHGLCLCTLPRISMCMVQGGGGSRQARLRP